MVAFASSGLVPNYPSKRGGLPRPLALPTQSLVFRFVDGPLAGIGVVAVVDVPGEPEIGPDTAMLVEVVFPDAPADEDFLGRRFEVWLGHPVGHAEIVAIEN